MFYIEQTYVQCFTKISTSMALLIKHSLNAILLGYLYVMQMFIKGFGSTYIQQLF